MNAAKKVHAFYKKHIWFQVSALFGITLLIVTLFFQLYMRKSYTDFLMEKNQRMETAVLEVMRMNLDFSLADYIKLGAQIAVDEDTYKMADNLFYKKEDTARCFMQLRGTFSTTASYSKNVLNLALADKNGYVYQYDRLTSGATAMWTEETADFLSDIYQKVYDTANQPSVPRYIVGSSPAVHPWDQQRVFHMFFPVVGKNNSFQNMNALLCVTFRMDILQPLLDIVSEEESAFSKSYITNENDRIIYHSSEEFIGKPEKDYLQSGPLTVLDEPLDSMGWTLHISLDAAEMDRNVSRVLKNGLVAYCFVLLALIFIFYLIIKRINKVIYRIQRSMQKIEAGSKREKVEIQGEHEIWRLAEGYNKMLDSLSLQDEKVRETHELSLQSLRLRHRAEFKILENQINAHFMYNTLGTINYEAMESGNYRISHMIKQLSNIMRYTFDRKSQNVRMYQEFEWIEQYLYLQKARLESVFDYEIKLSSEVAEWPCCKLMIQPFAENAILHGFEGKESGGLLTISAAPCSQGLRLIIQDNGCGMSVSKAEEIRQLLNQDESSVPNHLGIGVQNAAIRMRIFFGENLKITVESSLEFGTKFEFILPPILS